MLIGICGGICSGKKTVADYLVEHHGFTHLHLQLDSRAAADSFQKPEATELSSALVSKGSGACSPEINTTSQKPQLQTRFEKAEALLDFVTRRWRERYVVTDIPDEQVLDMLTRRPFFLLVSVDAPLTARWRRFQHRAGNGDMSLDEFVERSDTHLYAAHGGLQPLISRATVRLLNTSSSLAHLYATLGKLDLVNTNRLRPGWDTYFMALASLAAQRSNCMKRRVGCVLVGRGRRVISTGYNGTPRGIRNCGDGGCPRCNEGHGSGVGLATCLCIHAEENALLEAGRERIREGAVLYCDTCPCLTCSIKICQVGISEVVYAQGYSMDEEAAAVFAQAGVTLRQFIPPPNGLVHLERMELY